MRIKQMQDNDLQSGSKKVPKEQQPLAEELNENSYLSGIPEANPIQKRSKLPTLSIFPILPLPNFVYANEIVEPTNLSHPKSTSERLILPSSSLADIFANCIYVYNERALRKNNSDFGCIKVKYGESATHKQLKEQKVQWILQEEGGYHKSVILKPNETPKDDNILSSNSGEAPNLEERQHRKNDPPCIQSKEIDIKFESRFQSGNLCFAAKANNEKNCYNLLLTRDFNTSKCTQWFFFRTKNSSAGKVTFHILNFIKNYSVFENGMKICVASQSNSFRWARGCEQIQYRKTNIPIYMNSNSKIRSAKNFEVSSNVRCYYALSFSYTFEKPGEQVYFAYCYPYTYSMLESFLWKAEKNSPHFKRRSIATTPGNNSVDLITITNFKQKQFQKRNVVIMARVHPGETPSSFVCEGMMSYLLSDSPEANSLRDSFIFKFIPMLNPDGVINGSYRCSLSGYDLNRIWHRADRVSHPEIYGARKTIYEMNEKEKLFLIVDLHAHSKKKGIFMYGSQSRNNPYLCRQIPFLLWRNITEFNYYQCNFAMRIGREGTSRLFFFQELGLSYSYTMQHSFCGPSKERLHFTSKDYRKFGVNFLLTINKYFYCSRKKSKQNNQEEYFKELYENKDLLKVGDDDADSSSDEELDLEKKPINEGLESFDEEKKLIVQRENVRMSEGLINKKKFPSKNFQRTSKEEKKYQATFREPTIVKFVHTNKFLETARPLPVVGPSFKDKGEETSSPDQKERYCYSSLTNTTSKYFSEEKKKAFRETFRYEEEEQINSLTNLFLPSLTSASYKKYHRKTPTSKNMGNLGRNLLENAILIKEEIKSVQKKKPNWKQNARSFL